MSNAITPVLSVGAVMGDTDAEKAWGPAIGTLTMRVRELRDNVDSPVRLNVMFHVDGRLVPNDFEGVRTGRFRKKDASLIVQAAVPSTVEGDKGVALRELLADAVAAAESYARRKKLADDLGDLRTLVAEINEACVDDA